MDIEFAHDLWALIETERAAETQLPVAAIQSARLRLRIIRAAPDMQTMRNWRSLDLRTQGTAEFEHLVPIFAQWIMVLEIKEKNGAMIAIVLGIEEQIRGAA
jgi:toxin HigB-1